MHTSMNAWGYACMHACMHAYMHGEETMCKANKN